MTFEHLLIAIIILVFAVAGPLLKYIRSKRQEAPLDFPYKKAPILFSPAERSFLGVLEQALDGKYRIMGKVRLADVLKVDSGLGNSARQSAFNRIQGKHLDFVICDPSSFAVKFAVELDDKSHNQPQRQSRDKFVNEALRVAGVPVFHFKARQAYSVQEVKDSLFRGSVAVVK
jgi:hypothetical protein